MLIIDSPNWSKVLYEMALHGEETDKRWSLGELLWNSEITRDTNLTEEDRKRFGQQQQVYNMHM